MITATSTRGRARGLPFLRSSDTTGKTSVLAGTR